MKSAKTMIISKLIVVVFVLALIPAGYGLYLLNTMTITDGTCISEFTVDKFDKTHGVRHESNAVILHDTSKTTIIKNMTCAEYKNPTYPFSHDHPYWAVYSALVVIGEAGMLIAYLCASLCGWVDRKITKWKDKRHA